MDSSCTQLERWFTQPDHMALQQLATEEWSMHIAQCSRCRGTLALVLTEIFNVPSPAEAIVCDQCLDDLPAFIDYERLESIEAAARAFPEIWLHLLTCMDCAEHYRLVAEMLDEPVPVQTSPSFHVPVGVQLRVDITLSRSTLRRLMYARSQVHGAWGNEDSTIVAAAKAVGEYDIQLSIRNPVADQWVILIQVIPPVAGYATLTAGDVLYHLCLNADGQASQEISSDLLTALQGPDLLVSVVVTSSS
jgi:hypothetical protein